MSIETRVAKLETATDADGAGDRDFVVFVLGNNGRGPAKSGIYSMREVFGVMILCGPELEMFCSAEAEGSGPPPPSVHVKLVREPHPPAGVSDKRLEQHITRTWQGDPLPGWYCSGQAGDKTVWVVID